MKRKRFTEEQIIAVLREHEAGAKAGDLARKHGWSAAQAMREGVQRVLKGLPPDMAKRISVKTRSE